MDTVRRVFESLRIQSLVDRNTSTKASRLSAAVLNPAVPLFKAFATIQMLQPLLKKLRRKEPVGELALASL